MSDVLVFKRDRFTWFAYIMLGYFAYLQALPGTIMPFLRDELDLSYSLGGLHLSMLALGSVLVGAYGEAIVRRVGRRAALSWGATLTAIGALIFATGLHVALTIGGSFIIGLGGTMVLAMVNATLAEKFDHLRSYALTEANIVASIFAMIGPLLAGLFALFFIGWRGTLVVPVILWVVLRLRYFKTVDVPDERLAHAIDPETTQGKRTPLPLEYWPFWWVIVLGVAVEWCIAFWGAAYLDDVVELQSSTAAALMTVFFVAGVLGRAGGSMLTRRYPSEILLLSALLLAFVGFLFFWLAPVAWLNVLGLFVLGIGILNVYPLGVSAATNAAPTLPDLASTRVTLGVGTAMILMPQSVGALADALGMQQALMLVVFLLSGAIFMAWRGFQRRRADLLVIE